MAVEKQVLSEKETEKDNSKKQRPSYDYFNASNFSKMQTSTETTQKELDSFKTNYSASKLNRVYDKYDMYEENEEQAKEEDNTLEQDFAEQIERAQRPKNTSPNKDAEFNKLLREQNNFEQVEDTLTYQKVERDPKVKFNLNHKTKLMLFTYTFVICMLGFLLIYNAFAISNANANINNLNQNITAEQANIERVIKDIGNMTDESNMLDLANDLSFSSVPAQNIVQVSLYQKQTPTTYQGQTNWFDSICEFANNLFGG